VIRSEPRDGRVVTWAEFVEAGLLRGYRRDLQVSMVEVRPVRAPAKTVLRIAVPTEPPICCDMLTIAPR
jgi:hypothetical protein